MENQGNNCLLNLDPTLEEEDYDAVFIDEVPLLQQGIRLCLVGKIFSERDINKRSMSGMINGAWSHFCEPVVQEVPRTKNTFMFTFDNKEEMNRAWAGRPWSVSGNMLQLKLWDDSMKPQDINFDMVDF
ncbi:unnamed protein product [Linum trigynum]|uniref:DUF4283 domain-containing protein n=1 Tax=Linum trigynum TaxID=586398 RepID=A0AAV2EY50_9ROSI